jgi:hypothetical protein
MARLGFLTVCAALALVAAAAVHADSECVKGYHDLTPDERAAMMRVLETVRAALPAAPREWGLIGGDEPSVGSRFCLDAGPPWTYRFGRNYQNQSAERAAEYERQNAAAGEIAEASMAAKQSRIDALMAKMTTLGQALADAAQANDQAKVDAINREMEAISAEFERLMNEDDASAQVETTYAETMRDREMSIAVDVNPTQVPMPAGAVPIAAPPPGAVAALRWETSDGGRSDANALILLGAFLNADDGAGWSLPQSNDTSGAPVGYAIRIVADASRIDGMIQAIDYAALSSTLQR